MSRFERSWALFTRSLTVINQQKRLLLFPLIAGVFSSLIILCFFTPFVVTPTGHGVLTPEHWENAASHLVEMGKDQGHHNLKPLGYGLMGAIYFVSIFLATFFNVAFYHEILQALNGMPVSIRRGLGVAVSKIKPILLWSLLTGIVGWVIKSLEERFGVFGRLTMRLIGVAWSVAAVFVIPIILRDDKSSNPITYLKGSARILKKTWGEAVIGYLGMGTVSTLLVVAAFLSLSMPLALGIYLRSVWLIIGSVAFVFLGLMFVGFLLQAINQVYRCALFVYASEGVVPGPFDQELMEQSWRVKK